MLSKTKILLLLFLIMLIYGLITSFYINSVRNDLLQQKYEEVSHKMKNILSTLIDEKQEAISLVALSLSFNNDIKEALVTQNMEKIHFLDILNFLEKNSSLKNIWIQIIDNNGVSRYRSWIDKQHNDSVLKSRLDVVQMLQKPQVISSISTGQYDIAFKSMVPIYNKGIFIGSIEVIAKFNSIARKMKKDDFALLIIVDKHYKMQLSKVKEERFVNNYYISNIHPDNKLLEIFKKKNHLLDIENYIIDTKENILLTSSELHDISNNEMAYFLMSKELSSIDFSDVKIAVNRLEHIIVLVALILVSFLYYIYEMQYKNYIRRENEKLEKRVKSKTKELYFSANHDALTGLPNRVLFLDRLKQTLKHCARHKKNAFVLFLDLDQFKEINDTYGHEVGDKLLIEVAQRLQNVMREEDTIARLGGDEFTIIIEDAKPIDIENLVKKIIETMNEVFSIDSIKLQTSFSVGISSYPLDGETVEILVRNADTAMYKAKDAGKSTYIFYSNEMTTITKSRLQLKTELLHALAHNEFIPFYQPKINAKTNKIVGVEALIRWQHPRKGLVFPDEFLPFAQEVGLLAKIDKQMRVMSMNQATQWQKQGFDFGRISLNITTQNLANSSFLTELKAEIKETSIDTKRLEVEILESNSMENQEEVIIVLAEIQKLGVHIAIDDFGTGYSSLSYLQKLPVNTLKIDRSFVKDLPLDEDAITIVRVIISLANKLGLSIIAEGTETKEQVDFLVAEGCEQIQGYYYSKPIAAKEFEDFLIEFSS